MSLKSLKNFCTNNNWKIDGSAAYGKYKNNNFSLLHTFNSISFLVSLPGVSEDTINLIKNDIQNSLGKSLKYISFDSLHILLKCGSFFNGLSEEDIETILTTACTIIDSHNSSCGDVCIHCNKNNATESYIRGNILYSSHKECIPQG